MDIEKSFKNAKWFSVGILVLAIIVLVINIASGNATTAKMMISIAQIIVIIITIIGCSQQAKYGAICGIIVSILLIASLDILSIIFGVLYLIDCIKLLKNA